MSSEVSSEMNADSLDARPAAAPRRLPLRLLLLAALLIAGWILADRTGLRDSLSEQGIRQMMDEAGAFGMVSYLAAFAVGQLAQVPGAAFVLAARVAYGPFVGFLLAYLGALGAVSVSFFVVRGVGGEALAAIKWRWVERALARLDRRPVLTIVLLRTVFAVSPPLNYALAMSSTRFRHYFLGSAIGLVGPIAVYVVLSDLLLSAVR